MKKIITVFVVLILCLGQVTAKNTKTPKLKFNGNKYQLLYSTISKDNGSYLNEYYKIGETYNIWTEMVGIYSFTDNYSSSERAKSFGEYLSNKNCPNTIKIDEKHNRAVIDFLLENNYNGRKLMEYNVFKYETSKEGVSGAVQYVKRYVANNALDADFAKNDINKSRKALIKKVNKFKIKQIVKEPIDKCSIDSFKDTNETPVNNEQQNTIENLPENVPEENTIPEEAQATTINEENAETANQSVDTEDNKNSDDTNENLPQPENSTKNDKNTELNTDNSSEEHKSVENKEEDIKETKLNTEPEVSQNNNEVKSEDIKKNKTKVKKQKVVEYKVVNDKSEYDSRLNNKKKVNTKKEAQKRAKEAAKKLKDTL